ncbi:MAG: nitroreductase family protein [Oscillospiraceae bacterium]|nr:nitroreductase family protein [Oscillospiraceae bacterium]
MFKQEALEVLTHRRSIRKFKPEQIMDEELNAVLTAGTYAPTARGKQSPVIVAVQNPEERRAVSELNRLVLGGSADPYFGAPTILIVLTPPTELGPLDGAAVMTNLVNAAYAVGLGSCWVNRPQTMFAMAEGQAMLRRWGLEGEWHGVGSVALGYPDIAAPAPAPRKADYVKIIK